MRFIFFITVASLEIMTNSIPKKAEATQYKFISYNGIQYLSFDDSRNTYTFIPKNTSSKPQNPKNLFGGSVKNCSVGKINCMEFASLTLAVPCVKAMPEIWKSNGAEFTLIGRADSDGHKIWLIQSAVKGVPFVRFSYSRENGVRSISLQEEEASANSALTYFLVGDRGPLKCNATSATR